MTILKFTEAKLTNTGKNGVLKCDDKGYYSHVIGGLNTYNSAGEYYIAEGVKELFEGSSSLMRRVANGCLYGELGHPKPAQGMTTRDYMERVLRVEETNVCVHYAGLSLDMDYGRRNPQFKNNNLIGIIADLKPAGPKGTSLKEGLDNQRQNICFSIRALTKDEVINRVNYRRIVQIVTWDNVIEPGIAISNKWDSPSLETLSEKIVTMDQLEKLVETSREPIAVESRDIINETIKLVTVQFKAPAVPRYSQW